MDPVSFIVSALALGANTGIKEAFSEAGKDAYKKLKELISTSTRPLKNPSSSSKYIRAPKRSAKSSPRNCRGPRLATIATSGPWPRR
jgi:hypothetical protein